MPSLGLDEQKPDKRPTWWGNLAMDRDARKSSRHARKYIRRGPSEGFTTYPGRSPSLSGRFGPPARQRVEMGREKSAEAVGVGNRRRRAESFLPRTSRERLDGRGAAANRGLPTDLQLRRSRGDLAPRPGQRRRHPTCPVRGATNARGVRPRTSLDRTSVGRGLPT